MKPVFFLIPSVCVAALAGGLLAYSGAAGQVDNLTLGFSSYEASPVILTDFAIEQDLAPIEPMLVAGQADLAMPRMMGGNAISLPRDVGGDGSWVVSARWVELATDKAWTARIEVPTDALTVAYRSYLLLVIFGQNGELLIGSDKVGNQQDDRVDVARSCGTRTPFADRAWQAETGYFPEIESVMDRLSTTPGRPAYCQESR